MIHLDHTYGNRRYHFNEWLGFVFSRKINSENRNIYDIKNLTNNKKVLRLYRIVENPFLTNEKVKEYHSPKISWKIKAYIKLLILCYKKCYPLLILFSKFRFNIFENSEIAIKVFCESYPKNQNKLCLPRSIFAATTSKKFQKDGILIIGIFHPTRHMHAWIIENNINPYIYDSNWINYKPIALFF